MAGFALFTLFLTTAFVALDGVEPSDLDGIVRLLEPLLAGLDTSQLVVVGFGEGGTIALHLVLRHGWRCAGVLAFSPRLDGALPRVIRADVKIRLIEIDHEYKVPPAMESYERFKAEGAVSILIYGTPQTQALLSKLREDKIPGTSPGFASWLSCSALTYATIAQRSSTETCLA